eukprot:TRINITY_DN2013_c0_g1_i2.p1 TRINITY_DN2013_c0_g1~~TRINITY_DN2013_c0_g1_i2.p1  ORF type:complete len:506 (-),score=78.89 TRINITY_DN2013_c0_g1_i2:32-1549(-)
MNNNSNDDEIDGLPVTPRIISCPRQGTFGRNEVVWDMDNVHLYHIYVLGGAGVGKTQLLKNFADYTQSENLPGRPHCYQKQVRLLDKCINPEELSTILLQIVERSIFPDLSELKSIKADGVGFICLYAINSQSSFEEFRKFLDLLYQLNPKGEPPPTLLLANKTDLQRKITTQEGRELASSLACPFLEISAFAPTDEVFNEIIREISFKKEQEKLPLEKKGCLEKRSGELVKMWKKRWLVLQNGTLCFYRRENMTGKKGTQIDLSGCSVEDSTKIVTGFVIRTSVKTYRFRAPTIEQKIQWTRLIIRAREACLYGIEASDSNINRSGGPDSTNDTWLAKRKRTFRSSVSRYNSVDELFNVRPRSKSTGEMEDDKNQISEQSSNGKTFKTQSGPLGGPLCNGAQPNAGASSPNVAQASTTSSPRLSMALGQKCQHSQPVVPNSGRNSTLLAQSCTICCSSPRQKITILPADFDEVRAAHPPVSSQTPKTTERKKHWKLFGRSSFFQ